MKITVITDKGGNVVGTYRQPAQVPRGYPIFKIHGGPDHTVHELDLPAELARITSADELHHSIREHLKKSTPRK